VTRSFYKSSKRSTNPKMKVIKKDLDMWFKGWTKKKGQNGFSEPKS
jgi:hypothetical protein